MKKYYYKKIGEDLFRRPCLPAGRPSQNSDSVEAVRAIGNDVKKNGDSALKKYCEKFDKVTISNFEVSKNQIEKAEKTVSADVKKALKIAAENIEKFHKAQIQKRISVETMPGVKCSRESRAIEKVGLYIPGGSAPLPSTVLMLGIPAKIAGCKEVILCTPPNPADVIIYAAKLVGVNKIFTVGGAQSIFAMAYGTETIPKVDKIFGPGNSFVTAAKMLVQSEGVAIDIPAGPSEVLIIADTNARADFVAADLLSQAEHGADSQVVLVSNNERKLDEILAELEKQLALLPRKEIAEKSINNSFAVVVENLDQAMDFSNKYAPEHLIINTKNPEKLALKVQNAGSVFLGQYSCESAGDYASGTNHTLPTFGYSKGYSGVSLDSFQKFITFQKINKQGANLIGPVVETLANCEGLYAHKNAMSLRITK